MSQFIYTQNDLVEVDLNEFDQGTLILALLAIEAQVPGTLASILRQAALANGGWRISSNVSNPGKSINDQRDFLAWMRKFHQALQEEQAERSV